VNALGVGIAGLGTVGCSTVQVLQKHAHDLAQRAGRTLKLVAVSARDKSKNRPIDLSGLRWHDDPIALAQDPDVDIVVELIGGADGIALALSKAALGAGKHLVTANKALLAHHGTALALQAEKAGLGLGYEAAIAGGIPIIKAMREGLAANKIIGVYGILNGTCNYILSEMHDAVRAGVVKDFDAVLAEAQKLGYAEADPSMDVDGVDAAHKLSILASVAFGCPVRFDAVHVEGIRHISALDIEYAVQLGYRVKLLGIARETEAGIEQRVHPCMVRENTPIAHVNGANNAIVVRGDFVGATVYEGPGAGGGPTASAVVADLVDLARGHLVPTFAIPAERLVERNLAPMDRHMGTYYIRLMVRDKPGVIADITACLRDQQVSVESMLQRARHPDEGVPVMLTTHETEEAALGRALAAISALDSVLQTPRMIRIEELQ